MKDFSTILLVQIMQATIRCVEQTPGIDPNQPGVRQFEAVLLEEIARLVWPNAPQMEGPLV